MFINILIEDKGMEDKGMEDMGMEDIMGMAEWQTERCPVNAV